MKTINLRTINGDEPLPIDKGDGVNSENVLITLPYALSTRTVNRRHKEIEIWLKKVKPHAQLIYAYDPFLCSTFPIDYLATKLKILPRINFLILTKGWRNCLCCQTEFLFAQKLNLDITEYGQPFPEHYLRNNNATK